jgi:hypothetical protein
MQPAELQQMALLAVTELSPTAAWGSGAIDTTSDSAADNALRNVVDGYRQHLPVPRRQGADQVSSVSLASSRCRPIHTAVKEINSELARCCS